MNSKQLMELTVGYVLEEMLEKRKRKYLNKNNHVYCVRNGHHKRCYLVNDEWLCPICDKEKIENK